MPSLSLLLGLPIPYSSLGSLIPELFVGTTVATANTKAKTDPKEAPPKVNSELGSDVDGTGSMPDSFAGTLNVSMVYLADALLVNALQVSDYPTISLIITH